ncbi:MAG: hypothetical protein ACFFEV_07775, partial [Candidatus Thorarchaeota archaeon]
FIFGIVLMYKKPVSELTSPWQEDLSNRSWWTMLKPTRWHRMSPPYEDGKAEEKLDLDTEVVET